MTTPAWCEFVCVGCAVTIAGRFVFSKTVPRRVMARTAKKAGWSVREGDWCCRRCTAVKADEKG